MKYLFTPIIVLFIMIQADGQNDSSNHAQPLPYYEIPEYPDTYTPGNVAARVVDGLGYRYYWATAGLQEEDLSYKPSEDSRTIHETAEHIYRLSRTCLQVSKKEDIVRLENETEYSYTEIRKMTLENIQAASNLLKGRTAEELDEMNIVFKRADRTSEFPFWNLLNGMLSDAIYHTGQIVAFRRAAGNPVDFRMNVFTGKTREK